jgi:hypothetical protein
MPFFTDVAGVKECFDQFFGKAIAYDAASQTNQVHVVVFNSLMS